MSIYISDFITENKSHLNTEITSQIQASDIFFKEEYKTLQSELSAKILVKYRTAGCAVMFWMLYACPAGVEQ